MNIAATVLYKGKKLSVSICQNLIELVTYIVAKVILGSTDTRKIVVVRESFVVPVVML